MSEDERDDQPESDPEPRIFTLPEAERTRKEVEPVLIETGCLVKDLDSGLLDFPAIIDNKEVYLCWRLGEDRIRFYHGQREGFAGRKPLDPRDTGPENPIQ